MQLDKIRDTQPLTADDSADWQSLFHALMKCVGDGVVLADERGVIRRCNPALEALFGYEPGELVGRKINELMQSYDAAHHDDYLRRFLTTRTSDFVGCGSREVIAQHKDGHPFALDLAVDFVTKGDAPMFVGAFREQKEQLSGAALNYLSEHDSLTGLYNYHYLKEELDRVIERAKRGRATTPCALLHLDLDGFREINERFGYEEGDRVLREFASVLKQRCRRSDLSARLYADKFAVLLYDVKDEQLKDIAESFRLATDALPVARTSVIMHASAGVVQIDTRIDCLQRAQLCAEQACRTAKTQGGARTVLFGTR